MLKYAEICKQKYQNMQWKICIKYANIGRNMQLNICSNMHLYARH